MPNDSFDDREIKRLTAEDAKRDIEFHGCNALTWALVNGRLDLANRLFELGFDVNDNNPGFCSSALSEVAREGQLAEAEWLLSHGASVHGHRYEDQTPLHAAVRRNAECGDLSMIRLLLAHGADPHYCSWFETSAYDRCKSAAARALLDPTIPADLGGDALQAVLLEKRTRNCPECGYPKAHMRLDEACPECGTKGARRPLGPL